MLVDSKDRDYTTHPTPNEYRVRLPQTLSNVTSARLISAEIPRSFHTFSATRGNTTFDIKVGGDSSTVLIDDGNYTFTSLRAALETALQVATGLQWTVLFSSTTNQTIMYNEEGTEFTIVSPPSDRPTDYGLLFYLGFPAGLDCVSAGGKIVSPGPATFSSVTYILLDIEELRGAFEGGMYGSEIGGRPLAKIPVDPGADGIIMLDQTKCAPVALHQKPKITRLKELRIRFRYHDGTLVNFNGVDHSFVLCLETAVSDSGGGNSLHLVHAQRAAYAPQPSHNKVDKRAPKHSSYHDISHQLKIEAGHPWWAHRKWLVAVLAATLAMCWYVSRYR